MGCFRSNTFRQRSIEKPIYGFIAVIGVCYMVMWLLTPLANDDLWYLLPYKDYMEGARIGFPWNAVWQSWEWRYDNDNTRLANMLVPFTLVLLPKWLLSVLNAIMLMFFLSRASTLACFKAKCMFWPALFIATLIAVLPWSDQMLLTVFALNYVWTSAIICGVVLVWLKCKEVRGTSKIVLLALAGLGAGAMHECAAVPVVCGLVAYGLVNKGLSKTQWILMVAMALGAIILLSAPGPYHRAAASAVNALSFDKGVDYYVKVTGRCNMMCLLIACMAFLYGMRRYRPVVVRFVKSEGIIFVVASVVGYVVMLYTEKAPRVSWFSQLFGAIALFRLILSYMDFRQSRPLSNVYAYAVIALVLLHLGIVMYWCARFKNEYDEVFALYQKSASGVVHYDLISRPDDMLTLGKPYSTALTAPWCIEVFNLYYGEGTKKLVILPAGSY